MEGPGPEVTELRLVVVAADHTSALRFFRDVLGLVELPSVGSPDGQIAILDAGRATLELVDPAHADYIDDVEVGRRVAGQVRVALRVPDAEEATARAVEHGATLLAPPTGTPWGSRNARLDGPAGLQLTLFSGMEPGRD